MSLFILPQETFFGSLSGFRKEVNKAKNSILICNLQTTSQKLLRSNEQNLQIFGEKSAYTVLRGRRGLGIELAQKLKGVLMVKTKGKENVLQGRMSLLGPQQGYYKFQNNHQISQICRNLSNHQTRAGRAELRMAVNPETRQLHIIFSSLMINSPIVYGQQITTQGFNIVLRIVRTYIPYINQLIRCALKLEDNLNLHPGNQPNFHKEKTNILKYYEISTLSTQIKTHQMHQYNSLSQPNQTYSSKLQFVLQKKQPMDAVMLKSLTFFVAATENTKRHYSISQQQIQYIQELLCMPTEVKRSNGGENMQVVNYIYIKKPRRVYKEKISQGGFADIYQAEVRFWHIDLHKCKDKRQLLEQQYLEENLLEKSVVIKQQLAISMAYGNEIKQKQGRIGHQLKILQKMMTAKPIFTPKYYVPLNRPNPFVNCLLMDHIPSLTLTQFLKAYHLTVSLHTKLWFMFSIVQALRFIREYKIVHLDLKPSNILMFHQWAIKLIDFGESYHPDVCGQGFSPGYTIPYSCPELFLNLKTFTHLSDVYSLGVIFYEMLYSRTPFELSTNTDLIERDMQKYHEFWYFSPEEYETYSDTEVLRIMNIIISRCIARSPQQRPELDWIAVILRQLIEALRF